MRKIDHFFFGSFISANLNLDIDAFFIQPHFGAAAPGTVE